MPWWEYESAASYNARLSKQFLIQARTASMNWYTQQQAERYGISPTALKQKPTAFDQSLIDQSWKDKVVPGDGEPEDDGGGLFGDIANAAVDIGTMPIKAFLKAAEAETRYIAKPLAKRIYDDALREGIGYMGVNLPEYENLPVPAQFIMEGLASPSTWIGPGAALKALKAVPKMGVALPALGAVAGSVGSRRGVGTIVRTAAERLLYDDKNMSWRGVVGGVVGAAAGSSAAEYLGAPPIIGSAIGGIAGYHTTRVRKLGPNFNELNNTDVMQIVNPKDMKVYHGTRVDIPGDAISGKRGAMYRSTIPVLFLTSNPKVSDIYAQGADEGYFAADGLPVNRAPGAKVYPGILNKGAKIFDPLEDSWPMEFSQMRDKWMQWWGPEAAPAIKIREGGTPFNPEVDAHYRHPAGFLDQINGMFQTMSQPGTGQADSLSYKFIRGLMANGYEGVAFGDELAIWGDKAARYAYTNEAIKPLIRGVMGNDDVNRSIPNLKKALDDVRAKRIPESDKYLSVEYGPMTQEEYQNRYLRGNPLPSEEGLYENLGRMSGKNYNPEQVLTTQLEDSMSAYTLLNKIKKGEDLSTEDYLRAEELIARQDAFNRAPPTPGPQFMGPYAGIMGPDNTPVTPSDTLDLIGASAMRGKRRQRSVEAIQKDIHWDINALKQELATRRTSDLKSDLEFYTLTDDMIGEALTEFQAGRIPDEITRTLSNGESFTLDRQFFGEAVDSEEMSIRARYEQTAVNRNMEAVREELNKRFQAGGQGAGGIDSLDDIMHRQNQLPDDYLKYRSVDELYQDFGTKKTLTQLARGAFQKYAPTQLTSWLEDQGFNFIDNDLAFAIRELQTYYGQAEFMANAWTDQNRIALKKFQPTLNRLNTDITDVLQNLNNYKSLLTQEELFLAETIQAPITYSMEWARASKVANVPETHTPNGYNQQLPLTPEARARQHQGLVEEVTQWYGDKDLSPSSKEFLGDQQTFMKRLMMDSADSWFNEIKGVYGRSATELGAMAAPDINKELFETRRNLSHLDALDKALNAAITTGGFARPRISNPQVKGIIDTAQGYSRGKGRITKMAERKQAFRDLRDTQVRPLLKLQRARNQTLKRDLDQVERGIVREGGFGAFNTEFQNNYWPKQIAHQLKQQAKISTDNPISAFNNFIRPLIASLDYSFMGVQGLLGFARNPAAWVKSVHAALSSQAYDVALRKHADSGTFAEFLHAGGVFLTRNDLGDFGFRSFTKDLPPFRVANIWFARFGNAMRLELFDASKSLAKTPEDLRSLARTAGLATGYSTNPATKFETMALFAPRFFRSQFGILADAFTKGNIGGSEARRMLYTLFGGGVALTAGVNEVFGEKTSYDPRDPNFLRMRIAGQDVSVFGTWDTLMKAAAYSFKDGINPEAGAAYLLRSKSSPALRTLWDIMAGETWSGDQIDFSSTANIITSMEALVLQSTAPIALQDAIQYTREHGYSDLKNPEFLFGTALGYGGIKTTPLSPSERRDILALDIFNNRWRDLEPYQKSQLQEQYPDTALVAPQGRDAEAVEQRRNITLRFSDRQAELDARIPPGPEWVEAYQKLRSEQRGAYDQWDASNPELAAKMRTSTPKNENDAALTAYYNLFRAASEENWTPEDIDAALNKFDASMSPTQKAYIERNTGLRDTPTVKAYRDAQETLEPYWNIEDQVWDKLKGRSAELSRHRSADEYMQAEAAKLRQRGISEPLIMQRVMQLPLIRQFESNVRDLRARLRRKSRPIDDAVVKWYGAVPIRSQRS